MIDSINQLKAFRSAPAIERREVNNLLKELSQIMGHADWFTIGIMAPSPAQAIKALEEMRSHFGWPEMKVINTPSKNQPVFLKANQRTGDIHIRVEYGLGVGILLSCQHNTNEIDTDTFGPFPLDFFRIED